MRAISDVSLCMMGTEKQQAAAADQKKREDQRIGRFLVDRSCHADSHNSI
jgi:hypothetical protein